MQHTCSRLLSTAQIPSLCPRDPTIGLNLLLFHIYLGSTTNKWKWMCKEGTNSILFTPAPYIPSAQNMEYVYSKLWQNSIEMYDNWAPIWFKSTAHMWRNPTRLGMPVAPTLGGWDNQTPGANWPASLAKSLSFQFTERLCLNKVDSERREHTIVFWPGYGITQQFFSNIH